MVAPVTVKVEMPSAELRRLWAVDQVRRKRSGVGRAAEVAEMPRAAFMRLFGEHSVPVIDYPVEDLRQELLTASER